MANLSSDEVAKLVSDIAALRKVQVLQGTLIDQAEIGKRFDAATKELLTPNGDLDPDKWNILPPTQRAAVEGQLSKLRQELLDLKEVYAPEDGPADAGSLMHKDYASNWAIIVLTAIALFGLAANLFLICHEWEAATAGTRRILEFGTPSVSTTNAVADATSALSTSSRSPTEPAKPPSNQTPASSPTAPSAAVSPSPEGAPSVTASPTITTAAKSPAATSPAPATKPTSSGQDRMEKPGKVTEQAVLWMVILLGGLGGFLHLASSMSNYVGSRQLRRSWMVYYILIPFQGAALAPLVYLLLRVGVLNPANPGDSGRPMESLNLMGIYAFAALTGLFSKRAIEMLANVFDTIFKKETAKDSLEKPKPDAEKAGK